MPQIDTVIRMSEGAEGLTLDSCKLTFTDALVLRAAKATFLSQVFRGGIQVPAGTSVAITDSSLSFARSDGFTVRSDATATFTDTSLSFAAGVLIGIDVQQGGAATATGTTFQAADDTTVAVSVEEGGQFTVESSRLAGAEGAGCERAALPLRTASPTYAGTYA